MHSIGPDTINEVQHDLLVMWCHWHQHQYHMMLMVSPMAPVYSLGEDNWNEVQHDFIRHVMPLGPVSHDGDSIINGNIAFLRSKWLKWGATWLFGHVTSLTPVLHHIVLMVSSVAPSHSLGEDIQYEVQHYVFGHVNHWHQYQHHLMLMAS